MMRLAFLLLAMMLAACGSEKADTGGQKADSTEHAAESAPAVRTIALAELQQMIQNRDGKPLVLNMWATWCVPCKEEFPALVDLAEKNIGVADVVGVSLDFPEEIESQVIPFLHENPVNFPIYVANVASQDDFINAFNPDWSGALPTTFIYDSDGRQTAMMTGKRELADFEAAVSQTLPAGSSE